MFEERIQEIIQELGHRGVHLYLGNRPETIVRYSRRKFRNEIPYENEPVTIGRDIPRDRAIEVWQWFRNTYDHVIDGGIRLTAGFPSNCPANTGIYLFVEQVR